MIILSRPSIPIRIVSWKSGFDPGNYVNTTFYSNGRNALIAAIRALGVARQSNVLLPALICNSVSESILGAGYSLKYLDVDYLMQYDFGNLISAVDRFSIKVVVFVRYFGFPNNIKKCVESLRHRGVFIVEDCCHDFISDNVLQDSRLIGDARIYSLRKRFPVPDGGILQVNRQQANIAQSIPKRDLSKMLCSYLLERLFEQSVKVIGRPNIYSEKMSILRNKVGTVSDRSKRLEQTSFQQLAPSIILRKILRNDGYILKSQELIRKNYLSVMAMSNALGFKCVFPSLPDDCIPQWCPVFDWTLQLVPWLRRRGIGASRWPWHDIPHEVANMEMEYSKSVFLNKNIALLPIHQSIGLNDIMFLKEQMEEFAIRFKIR